MHLQVLGDLVMIFLFFLPVSPGLTREGKMKCLDCMLHIQSRKLPHTRSSSIKLPYTSHPLRELEFPPGSLKAIIYCLLQRIKRELGGIYQKTLTFRSRWWKPKPTTCLPFPWRRKRKRALKKMTPSPMMWISEERQLIPNPAETSVRSQLLT